MPGRRRAAPRSRRVVPLTRPSSPRAALSARPRAGARAQQRPRAPCLARTTRTGIPWGPRGPAPSPPRPALLTPVTTRPAPTPDRLPREPLTRPRTLRLPPGRDPAPRQLPADPRDSSGVRRPAPLQERVFGDLVAHLVVDGVPARVDPDERRGRTPFRSRRRPRRGPAPARPAGHPPAPPPAHAAPLPAAADRASRTCRTVARVPGHPDDAGSPEGSPDPQRACRHPVTWSLTGP